MISSYRSMFAKIYWRGYEIWVDLGRIDIIFVWQENPLLPSTRTCGIREPLRRKFESDTSYGNWDVALSFRTVRLTMSEGLETRKLFSHFLLVSLFFREHIFIIFPDSPTRNFVLLRGHYEFCFSIVRDKIKIKTW